MLVARPFHFSRSIPSRSTIPTSAASLGSAA
jgi:hypothetical protein